MAISMGSKRDREKTNPLVKAYLDAVETWETGDPDREVTAVSDEAEEFRNDGERVAAVRKARLDWAARMREDPATLADPALAGKMEYLKADLAYLDRPDPATTDYADFVRQRAVLRDKVFKGKSVLSADDYAMVAGRTQNAMRTQQAIQHQYDLMDLRQEAALEHFDDPRFVVGIYRHKDGLMDELLVDLDRRDLLAGKTEKVNFQRSDAQAAVFDGYVQAVTDPEATSAERVQNFALMREAGLQVRGNQRAVARFADKYPPENDQESHRFEIGMAGLDNTRWGEGMFKDWVQTIPKSEVAFLKKHSNEKDATVAAFMVSRKLFDAQVQAGDPAAAESFAVMERSAGSIAKNSVFKDKLVELGGADDVAALHAFGKDFRAKKLDRVEGMFDEATIQYMQASDGSGRTRGHIAEGKRMGMIRSESEDGGVERVRLGKDTAIEVVDGAHIRVAQSAADLEAGKGVVMRLDGIVAPPEGVSTRGGRFDAGLESKAHLQEVITRHGVASLGMDVVNLDSGESTLKVTLSDGDNLSQRMLHDGYAQPTKDSENGLRRESMAKQAESNNKGLWKDGFPEMDQSWRREKGLPELTWKDKRHRLQTNVNAALCATDSQVYRNLTRSETKLFALPLKKWSASNKIDREILKAIDRNPSRALDIYNSNMEVMGDLRKREDTLTQGEKYAHDQLAMGRRALGEALVTRNLLDEKKFKKDTKPFMSRSGIELSKNGIRAVTEATVKTAEAVGKGARSGVQKGGRGLLSMIDMAMK